MPVGMGFLSAFLNRLVLPVRLEGDPLITHNVGGAPACAGFAFDGTHFYLNDFAGAEIHVYTAAGVFVRTMSLGTGQFYDDIDYDPVFDELLGVSTSYTGINRFSKMDGHLLGTYGPAESAFLNDQFTSIAVDRYNDLIYLEHGGGMWIYALKMSTFGWGRMIYIPFTVAPSPAMSVTSTMMIALDAENRKKIWVGYKSFPPLLGRVDEDDKIDAFRLLGTGYYGGKSSIGIRYANERWYCWVGAGDGLGKLYELSGMPGPVRPTPALVVPAFDQDIYRWYENDDAENPTPKAAENTGVEEITLDEVLRLRLGVLETTGTTVVYGGSLKLQYATDPAGPWSDVGAQGDEVEAFRYSDGLGEDFAEIANLLLSTTTVKEHFIESSPSAPGLEFRGPDRGEWDICIQAHMPASETDYFFRVVTTIGALIKEYTALPQARTGVLPWLAGFDYRKNHVIKGGADPLTDYPVGITVHRSTGVDSGGDVYVGTKCRTDFGDIRFTGPDRETLLDYWLESYDGDVATFRVCLPSIPESPDSIRIWVYYGKSDATSISDIDAVLEFYDFFDDDVIDTDKWTITGSPSESGGQMHLNGNDKITAKVSFGVGYTFVARCIATERDTCPLSLYRDGANYSDIMSISSRPTTYFRNPRTCNEGSCDDHGHYTTVDVRDSHRYEQWHCLSDRIRTWIDTTTGGAWGIYTPRGELAMRFYVWQGLASQLDIDWCYVMKRAYYAPSHQTWGPEEEA